MNIPLGAAQITSKSAIDEIEHPKENIKTLQRRSQRTINLQLHFQTRPVFKTTINRLIKKTLMINVSKM